MEPDTKRYIEQEGVACPYCSSTHIRSTNAIRSEEGGRAEEDMTCDACGSGWTDLYTLTGVDYHEER